MNRIVLIGNGFDLANDYKTSYKDFIVWYFKEKLYDLCCKYKYSSKDELCKLNVRANTYDNLSRKEIEDWDADSLFDFLKGMRGKSNYEVTYSQFLSKIIKSVETKGWVDIENEYYKLLCSILTEETDNYAITEETDSDVNKLNAELNTLGKKLIEYLTIIIKDQKEIHQEIQKKYLGLLKKKILQ